MKYCQHVIQSNRLIFVCFCGILQNILLTVGLCLTVCCNDILNVNKDEDEDNGGEELPKILHPVPSFRSGIDAASTVETAVALWTPPT